MVKQAKWGGWREMEIKANSAQLKLELVLSLAKTMVVSLLRVTQVFLRWAAKKMHAFSGLLSLEVFKYSDSYYLFLLAAYCVYI